MKQLEKKFLKIEQTNIEIKERIINISERLDVLLERTEPLQKCLYFSDGTTSMHCAHCGKPEFLH
jgi:hypothetical protein